MQRPDDVLVADLGEHPVWARVLARWHYDQWGPLTGAASAGHYEQMLRDAADSRTVPSVLVAVAGGQLLGSASLVASDLPIRPTLTPWLAQLFVAPSRRRHGVGAALVAAVLERAHKCGYRRVFLFTSGTLPQYYSRLGWRVVEGVEYLGRERTVMDCGVEGPQCARAGA